MTSLLRKISMEQYNEQYFQQEWVEKKEPTLQRYLDFLPPALSKTAFCLDIGCSTGRLVKLLRGKGYSNTFGIDIALPALTIGKAGGLDLALASAEKGLPFATNAFDVIFFLDVVEHLTRPYEALVEIRRILKDNGLLVITTPNAGSIIRLLLGKRWYALKDKTHLYYFDSFSMTYILAKAGYRIEKKHTYSGLSLAPLNFVLERSQQGGQLTILAKKADGQL